MAGEWTLEETRALVEAHIELKQHEKPIPQGSDSRAVSEHWDKVAKKLRERGYHRSLKSCNKRWYRLEQYEVQIFSFNIEEAGNHPNYWELTRAERYEHRANNWPQLPLGEGIDKEIFDLIKRFSQGCVEKKVTQSTAPNFGLSNTRHPLPEAQSQVVVLEEAKEPKILEGNSCWSSLITHQIVSSQDPLDGFKLQARELRKQRATELRRGNRTVPYNANHTTFVKACQAPQVSQAPDIGNIPQQKTVTHAESAKSSVPISKLTDLGSETKVSVQSSTSAHQFHTEKAHSASFDSPPFSYKLEMNPLSQPAPIHLSLQLSCSEVPENHVTSLQLQPSDKPTHQTSSLNTTNFPVLQSINSHLPLLQPTDNNMQPQHHLAMMDHNQHSMLDGDNLPSELLQLSFQEQLEALLYVHNHDVVHKNNCEKSHPEVLQQTQQFWQAPNSQPWQHQYRSAGHGNHHGILGVAIGNLEMQLHALMNLLQARNTAEQQYQEKMLLSFESMAISLRTIAQGNV